MTNAHRVVDLTTRLESIMTRALAISMGRDLTTDASALHDEANPVWREVAEEPAAMLPVVTEMAARLAAELAAAPAEVKELLRAFRDREAEARGEWLEPPRAVAAFVFLDALERIRAYCAAKTNA